MKRTILIFTVVLFITQSTYTKDISTEDSRSRVAPKSHVLPNNKQEKVDIVDPKINRIPDKTSEDFCKKYPTLC